MMERDPEAEKIESLVVGVVGPCSSGKSTLVRRLREADYRVREIRQEHSVAPKMWLLFAKPDLLIYLDVAMETAAEREGLSAPSSWWREEREVRLAHARAHCDLYLDTTAMTPAEVAEEALEFLRAATET